MRGADLGGRARMSGGGVPGVVVGIVAFRPAPERLLRLAQLAASEGEHAIVFANGALDRTLAEKVSALGVELIEAECNLGVAEALNIIALAARLRGARQVLLLDDDAAWPAGGLARLSRAFDALSAAGENAAIIGPRIAAPNASYIAPRYFNAGARAYAAARGVRYIITSGSLVDLAALAAVGPFRSDFFIDMIDVEWCFRAWARGYSCWCAEEVAVEHSVGQGEVRALGMRATRQPQFRFRAYVRNLSHCLTLAHVPWQWKLRFAANIVRLCVVYQFSAEPRLYRWIWRELWDGLSGKLGPPRGAQNVKTLDLG